MLPSVAGSLCSDLFLDISHPQMAQARQAAWLAQ